jgi:NAD(P)-dependent dehydrogenase (short-subunit alcohol dehydrogenase family)
MAPKEQRIRLKEKTSFPDSRIDGQVVLVTGASRVLGRWIAAGMAHAGARVVLVSRSLEGSENAAEEIARQGADVLPLEADVADAGAAVAMVQQTIAHFGRIDCLVNNAGINVHKPMLEITPEDFDLVSSVNFRGVYFTSQAAARQMIDQGGGGRINNISSSAGVLLLPQIPKSVYAGTKAAVILLS